MPSQSNKSLAFDSTILKQLACPVCFSELKAQDSGIHCLGCGRIYPVVDGIPVLIPGRAINPQ
jgi:uncharacterized protein YbaR (Trm112 family)